MGYSTVNGIITDNKAENCNVYYSTDDGNQIGGEIAGKRSQGVSGYTTVNVNVIKVASSN